VDRLAGLIGPRHTGRPSSLDAAASLIERELSQSRYEVARQPYRIDGLEVANLVAELPESLNVIRLSDNSSFWDQGYPALMVTDTSFLRNPHYHLPGDVPETLDYPRMAQAALGVAGAISSLAGNSAFNS